MIITLWLYFLKCSYLWEMHTKLFIGFSLNYSNQKKKEGTDETRVTKIRINVGIEGCVHGGSLILLCVTEIFHYKKFFF